MILSQRPPNYACTTATSTVYCIAACLTCSTSCSIASPALSAYIFCCVSCRLANLPLMVAMSTWASSSQAPILALRMPSFHCVASACSFSAFASYSFSNFCVMALVRGVALTSSYLFYSSLASISNLCRLRSSCRLVTTSSDCSKSTVHSFTTTSMASTTSLTGSSCYSLAFGGVKGWALNSSFVILRFSSSKP